MVEKGEENMNDYKYTTEYDDFTMMTDSFEDGAEVAVYDNSSNESFIGKIVKAIINTEFGIEDYENNITDMITEFEPNCHYDYSGEFITDDFCAYVFVELV